MAVDPAPATQHYWDTAAGTYDRDFTGTLIGQLRREAVWRRLDRVFHPPERIIELNCGTGIDALHLVQRGVQVLACDISPGMIHLARERARGSSTSERAEFRVLATESLAELQPEGPFDGAFSNFAGLNCVRDLPAVARALHRLLKPGAQLVICMIGKFVPWEIAWFLAHGNPRRAGQRLGRAVARTLPGGVLNVHYPSVRHIARSFAPGFRLHHWTGMGILVPPSYLERWASRFPAATKALAAVDAQIGGMPVIRGMADSVLLEFERIRETDAGI